MRSVDIVVSSVKLLAGNIVAFFLASLVFIVGSVFIIPMPPLMFGLFYMANKAVKEGKTEAKDILRGFRYFVKSWVLSIVLFALGMFGSVLIILMAFWADNILVTLAMFTVVYIAYCLIGLAFVYSVPLMIERGCGVFAAIKESLVLFKRRFVATIIVAVLSSFIGLVLAMTFIGMGLSYVLSALVFTKLALEE